MARFIISALREGPDELRDQLPLAGITFAGVTGPDGNTYFCAHLDHPIAYRGGLRLAEGVAPATGPLGVDGIESHIDVTDIVMRAANPGEQPHYGMRGFVVDVAYAIAPGFDDHDSIDFAKIVPVATAEIDSIDGEEDGAPETGSAQETSVQQHDPVFGDELSSSGSGDFSPSGAMVGPMLPIASAEDSHAAAVDAPGAGERISVGRGGVSHEPEGFLSPVNAPPRIYPSTPSTRLPSDQELFNPRTLGKARPGKALIVAAGTVAVVAIAATIGWLILGSGDEPAEDAAPPTATSQPAGIDTQRVKAALPEGYSDEDCAAAPAATDTTPALICGPNADPDGPQSATYTIYPNRQALNSAFEATVEATQHAICPGNIQSPGPWRRNANPEISAGTLYCGTRSGQAVVIWTSDAQFLLNVAEAGAQGPPLDRLYAWWTTHS